MPARSDRHRSSSPGLRLASSLLLLVLGCGDDGAQTSATEVTADASGGATSTETDGSTSLDSVGTSDESATSPDGTATGPDTTATDDTGSPSDGPVLLYDGPVSTAAVPGWDPAAPRPVLIYRQIDDQWRQGIVEIQADGSLVFDADMTVNIWGWESPPPQLHDGPPMAGSIPGWSVEAPTPIVKLEYDDVVDVWRTALVSINADGSLTDNFSPRLIVWGWSGPVPGAPSVRYEGPVDGGVIPGWDPSMSEPLLMMTRSPGSDTWLTIIASIGPAGEIIGNLSNEIVVWSW